MTPERTAFLAAEVAYKKATRALYKAAGLENAPLEDLTRLEISARAYATAADAYRVATRAWLNASKPNNDAPPSGGA